MEISRSQQNDFAQAEERFQADVKARNEQREKALTRIDADSKQEIEQAEKRAKQELEEATKGYKVELSTRKATHEADLAKMKEQHESERKDLEKEYAAEFDKISNREHNRIEAYRKNQEEVLKKLQDKFMTANETAKKSYDT